MVWIHGGGFSEGSSSSSAFTGGPIVSVGDVILVTISYRLSIFATFTTSRYIPFGSQARVWVALFAYGDSDFCM